MRLTLSGLPAVWAAGGDWPPELPTERPHSSTALVGETCPSWPDLRVDTFLETFPWWRGGGQ